MECQSQPAYQVLNGRFQKPQWRYVLCQNLFRKMEGIWLTDCSKSYPSTLLECLSFSLICVCVVQCNYSFVRCNQHCLMLCKSSQSLLKVNFQISITCMCCKFKRCTKVAHESKSFSHLLSSSPRDSRGHQLGYCSHLLNGCALVQCSVSLTAGQHQWAGKSSQ